jgi:hypothetical protein
MNEIDPGPVVCTGCRTFFPLERFSRTEKRWLIDQLFLERYHQESEMLRLVGDLFRRHPHIEQEHGTNDSKDWYAWSRLEEPLDVWIDAYRKRMPNAEPFTEADKQAVDYLRHCQFWYPGRLSRVVDEIKRLRRAVAKRLVICPSCYVGRLKLDPTRWQEPGMVTL